ncbi:hypothetical protein Despr_1540 [Desulfobulbus propionicus DSM 2032]|jgi:hypothetical protein|uniref:STAS/SEC14 domain-containing protein n=1 Tax=Desulfobulbus propionicus (strain ATCC 33891 / DSM 2032 / VKM B-1956 / 1pr3) TaxID=577650 RepID=A0A7U4DP54_DESPD|nr:hypothetical protein [Desulfobulbus propionicus]ADW17694.1 hypothetical protein Despr_1540 [Desulfobulbus propionicus DSM 2032]
MRFRISKQNDGTAYSIVVTGELTDDTAWDILQIAQTMLGMAQCRELVIDLRSAVLDEELSVFNTDILVSVFEEGLLKKDSSLVLRFRDESEIRLCSDQLPLEARPLFANVPLDEAKFYGRALKWLEQEARFLVN